MKNLIYAIVCASLWGILVAYTKDYLSIRLLISAIGGFLIGNYFFNRETKSYKNPNITLLQRKLRCKDTCSCTYDEVDEYCYWHGKNE